MVIQLEYEDEIKAFKLSLLRALPFYGEVLLRVPVAVNRSIKTACTNGSEIQFNPDYFKTLSPGERNFVIMHEVLHIILRHCVRRGKRSAVLWNVAADIIVNDFLFKIIEENDFESTFFQVPPNGIYADVNYSATTENIYARLCGLNDVNQTEFKGVTVDAGYRGTITVRPREDIITTGDVSPADYGFGQQSGEMSDAVLKPFISKLYKKYRNSSGSFPVPYELEGAMAGKRVRWDKLLRQFLTEKASAESSYHTPERKYLHMDLIIPGIGTRTEQIGQIWAFADCSGSVSESEMKEFLFQLKAITKAFKCEMNICYWDTAVSDVYTKIKTAEQIENSLPKHTGGTDVNCIYKWLRQNGVKPDLMLILTDGMFGSLDDSVFMPGLKRRTILVINNDYVFSEDFKRIGKITRI